MLPADFTRCPGGDCPSRLSCARFLDRGNGGQVVLAALYARRDPGSSACPDYIVQGVAPVPAAAA